MLGVRSLALPGDRRRLALTCCAVAVGAAGIGIAARAGVWSSTPASAAAAPAAAKVSGRYVSQVTGVVPAVTGLTAQVEGNGLMLMNHGSATATVLGYAGEPFLTIGPAGVRENTASVTSAVLARKSLAGRPAQPAARTAKATWTSRGKDTHYRWADLRVQWQQPDRAPAVRPASGDVVGAWEIPVKVGTRTVAVRGVVRWVAGASS